MSKRCKNLCYKFNLNINYEQQLKNHQNKQELKFFLNITELFALYCYKTKQYTKAALLFSTVLSGFIA